VERVLDALASASAHRPVPLDRRARDEAENAPRDWVAIEEHGFARIEDEILVDSLLDVLSPRERIVVALRFHEDLLQREVAELVGISQMQVSRTLASATAKLREAARNEPKPLLLTVD
jgi:RNA polymerase sigma-B factor